MTWLTTADAGAFSAAAGDYLAAQQRAFQRLGCQPASDRLLLSFPATSESRVARVILATWEVVENCHVHVASVWERGVSRRD
jgi:hypothetical protein